MNTTDILKLISLTLAIWFGFINIVKWSRGQAISFFNGFLMGFSWAGFIYLMFLRK